MEEERKPLVSVRKKDLRIDYYKGTGCGGQKKNKTSNCCRITHIESGAVGKSEAGRSQSHNRTIAFVKMSETSVFKIWMNRKAVEAMNKEDNLSDVVEDSMKEANLRIELRENRVWKKQLPELK